MITFMEFKGLSPEQKNNEILKYLPLLVPLGEDFSKMKNNLNSALDTIVKLECDYGILCPKTRSVDDILKSSYNRATPNQFSSVGNIHKTSSVGSILRNRGDLIPSDISSSGDHPLPDVSGTFITDHFTYNIKVNRLY